MSARSLTLEAIAKRFGRSHEVLGGLDLSVAPGASLALLGPSGSGKSTVLRLVAGLERPDHGSVRLGGTVVAGPGAWVAPELRGVGLVFQEHELWPHRTTAENIAFGLAGRPRGRAALEHPRVRELAERLGIAALLARTPERLSGGERQRAALARTLAPQPDVLLLDEPLAALDATRRSDLLALLRAVALHGAVTTLVVTHDPDEALALGQTVAVLDGGRIVEQGPGPQLYAAPRTVAGARALGEASLLPAQREGGLWHTALGSLEAARSDDGTATRVLLRPESVCARRPDAAHGAGRDAREVLGRVLACWSRRVEHGVRVAVGAEVLSAVSREPLTPGEEVTLAVTGPVVGVLGVAVERLKEHVA